MSSLLVQLVLDPQYEPGDTNKTYYMNYECNELKQNQAIHWVQGYTPLTLSKAQIISRQDTVGPAEFSTHISLLDLRSPVGKPCALLCHASTPMSS